MIGERRVRREDLRLLRGRGRYVDDIDLPGLAHMAVVRSTQPHALITGIDPPPEVDSALAAINTAHNHVSSEISLAQAAADQRIVQSKRAVEIETLNAQAEVEPLLALAAQLRELAGAGGPGALAAYVRNAKVPLHKRTRHLVINDIQEVRK